MVPDDPLRRWLGALDAEGVTDLHLKPGSPPRVRRKGRLEVVAGEAPLERADIDAAVAAVLESDAVAALAERGEAAATLSVAGHGRFRVRAQRQRGSTLLLLRRIPDRVPSLDELGLPA